MHFLPIYSEHQVRWTYQPGSHRRKVTGFLIHLPSAVRALIFLARRIQQFLSLVDLVFLLLTIQSFPTRWAFVFFYMSPIELYLVYKQIQTAVVLYCASTYISYASTGRPSRSEVPRNPLTRWDVSSTPANGIFLTKILKNKNKNAQRVEND